jgi:hypothetical protein
MARGEQQGGTHRDPLTHTQVSLRALDSTRSANAHLSSQHPLLMRKLVCFFCFYVNDRIFSIGKSKGKPHLRAYCSCGQVQRLLPRHRKNEEFEKQLEVLLWPTSGPPVRQQSDKAKGQRSKKKKNFTRETANRGRTEGRRRRENTFFCCQHGMKTALWLDIASVVECTRF